MNIGERLKIARNRADMTQEELAKKMGVASITILRWEKGTHAPGSEDLFKIAQVLNTSVAFLMGESEDPTRRVLAVYEDDNGTIMTVPEIVDKTGRHLPDAPKFQASQDIDQLMKDLASIDPDFGVLFRGAVTNWSQLPPKTKEKIAQIFKVGLGLAEIDSLGGEEITSDDQF